MNRQNNSPEARKERALKVVTLLRKNYSEAKTSLDYGTPLQLLISTILSAQCTDARVNMVTPALFERYRTARDFAEADRAELESYIRSVNFYSNKAKNIIACTQAIVERHGGEVPSSMEELTALAGVGRKTANCVLGSGFGIASGVVVDTHVARVSFRLGLTAETNPEKIEADLNTLIPKRSWIFYSHAIILHGRQICIARAPKCPDCIFKAFCPSAQL
ncbi:MAG: endonuclease III [Acidobacteriota bacterium]